jgi:hypothetical protein
MCFDKVIFLAKQNIILNETIQIETKTLYRWPRKLEEVLEE